MFTQVNDDSVIAETLARAERITDGPGNLSQDWLAEGRVAIVEESGWHIEPDQAARLESALHHAGITTLYAVTNEFEIPQRTVHELSATQEDFAAFSYEYSNFNALILPQVGDEIALLYTTDDYHLVAGPREFVTDYVGNLEAARAEFSAFYKGHFEFMQPPLRAVADRYMSWF